MSLPVDCQPHTTAENCALAAQWAAAEAAELSVRWIEYTLYAQIAGGIVTGFAALFAFLAYRQARKATKAAEQQAQHAEKQVGHAEKQVAAALAATRAQVAAAAAQVRPHVRFPDALALTIEANGRGSIGIKVSNEDTRDIYRLKLAVALKISLDDAIEFDSGEGYIVESRAVHLHAKGERSDIFPFAIDPPAFDLESHTWRSIEIDILATWQDELNYSVTERNRFHGANLYGQTSYIQFFGVEEYQVSPEPVSPEA